jgi:hypothetical protein
MTERKQIRANEILEFMATEDKEMSVAEAMASLSMALCQLAVTQRMPKENIMLGMSMSYDKYVEMISIPEGTQCH